MLIEKSDGKEEKEKRDAFDALVGQYYQRLYNYARRLTRCPSLAEDVTQEALIRAYRHYNLYDTQRPFMAWISRIAHNVYIDGTRVRHVASVSLEVIGGENNAAGNEDGNPERLILEEMLDERLEHHLKLLPPPLRTAIILCDVYGWSYEEIGKAMQSSPGTTRSRIHRARKRLHSSLCAKGWKSPRLLLSAAGQ